MPAKPASHLLPAPLPWRNWLLIALVAVLAHGLCLWAGFYHDDAYRFGPRWMTGPLKLKPYYLLVTRVTDRGLYELVGLWSPAFHAVTLVLHVIVSILTFELAQAWFPRAGVAANICDRAALWGALLFATHPLASEVTNYARCNDLGYVMAFSLGAALAGLRWLDHGWKWFPVMLVGMALAGLSKGPGIWHAIAIVSAVLVTTAPIHRLPSLALSPGKRIVTATAASVLIIGAAIQLPFWLRSLTWRITEDRPGWHLLTQSRIAWQYLRRCIWPTGLCSDHHIPWTMSTGDVPAWIAAGTLILLCSASLWLLFRRRTRIYGALLCLVLFPMLLRFPYSTSELMVEYRMYPALPFVGMIGGLLLATLSLRNPAVARAATGVIVAIFCLMSAARATRWHGPYAANEDVLIKYPTRLRAHWEIMRVDYEAGDYDAVLARAPAFGESALQVQAYNSEAPWGRSHDLHHFAFSDITCRCYLARALAMTGRRREALALFEQIRIHLIEKNNLTDPYSLGAFYHHRGLFHLEAGRPERALEDLRIAEKYAHHTFPLAPSLAAAEAALAETRATE